MTAILVTQRLGEIKAGDRFDFQGTEWTISHFDVKAVAVPTGQTEPKETFHLGFIDCIKAKPTLHIVPSRELKT
jgi:hypothetical protein